MSIQHWPRWVFASVSQHFVDRRQGLHIFVEGVHRNTRTEKDFIELRVDGPYLTELSKGYWRIYGEVNVLVQSAMDDEDFHRVWKDVGIVVAAFTSIEIFKYGDESYDDGSLLGCYKLVFDTRGKERVQISQFGKIGPNTALQQATVEAHYEMHLKV